MKRIVSCLLAVVLTAIVMTSCTKSNSNTTNSTKADTITSITIDSTTYSVIPAGRPVRFDATQNLLEADLMKGSNEIFVSMYFNSLPTGTKTYSIASGLTPTSDSTVAVEIDGYEGGLAGTGVSGETVKVTVDNNGKITATTSKVTLSDGATITKYLSGTLIAQ